jgi:hypothetical protein
VLQGLQTFGYAASLAFADDGGDGGSQDSGTPPDAVA